MSHATYQTYQRSGQTFYCTHGHQQHFTPGKSDLQMAREELDRERRARQRAEQRIAEAQDQAEAERRRANGYKGHAAKLAKRAKAGVCPCCNRTFVQLARHMASQHSEFVPLDLESTAQGVTVQ